MCRCSGGDWGLALLARGNKPPVELGSSKGNNGDGDQLTGKIGMS